MTVGLPGAGIGGLFYLLSALFMPVHAGLDLAFRKSGIVRGASRQPPWGLIWRQFATAVAIIAGLWLTGWALAALLLRHPGVMGQMQSTDVGKRLPNVLRVAAVMVSLATLFGVLAVVQIARLVVSAEVERRRTVAAAATTVATLGLLCIFIAPVAAAQGNNVRTQDAARHIAAADSAFTAEDTAAARREYEAALRIDPTSSRALYRLGQLNRRDPRQAVRFFRRYTDAEPTDAWGWIALGEAFASEGRFGDALSAYASAARIAPTERDVVTGRARLLARAGRTDDAIGEYERWTLSHPADAEALRNLGDQRRRAGRFVESARAYQRSLAIESSDRARQRLSSARAFAAPAVEALGGGSTDSDENRSVRAGGVASANVTDRTRAQISASRRRISGIADMTVDDASVGIVSRPLAAFRLEASGGVARPGSTSTITITTTPSTGSVSGNGRGRGRTVPPGTVVDTTTQGGDNIFIGSVRGVWRQPGGHASLDLRATRTLLDATSILVINRVVRNEVAGRADLLIVPRVRLRAGGRAGTYSAAGGDNTRLSLLGGLAVSISDAAEISGIFQRLTFGHATSSGYFAPRVAQLAEGGTYAEFESESGVLLAVDGGAGFQRLQEFGGAMGRWEPAYRLFASLDVPLRPASGLHFEMDSYDSRLGSDVATTASSWRFISFSAALRLALR